MISKTKISKRIKKKTDNELVEALSILKKINPELASLLSGPTRKRIFLNLNEINKQIKGTKEGIVIVPGKVLGQGDIDKKIEIIALSFSEQAEEKLKKAGCKIKTILESIKQNKKLEGKILR